MRERGIWTLLSVVLLPLMALAAYAWLAKPTPAHAENPLCVYAGKTYSTGAQVADNCKNGMSQYCLGRWELVYCE